MGGIQEAPVPMPKMHPVDSSSVAKVGYDSDAKEAYVEFHDSGLYAYGGVSARAYEKFMAADSKGTFVNEVIKPRYPFRKV
jgi:KTSC domain